MNRGQVLSLAIEGKIEAGTRFRCVNTKKEIEYNGTIFKYIKHAMRSRVGNQLYLASTNKTEKWEQIIIKKRQTGFMIQEDHLLEIDRLCEKHGIKKGDFYATAVENAIKSMNRGY